MTPISESNPFPTSPGPAMDTMPNSGTTPAGSTTTDDMVNRTVQGAHRAVDRVAERAAPAVERLRVGVNDAAGAMQERVDQFGEVKERWVADSRNYVREHPLAAVGAALAAGMLLSRLLRR